MTCTNGTGSANRKSCLSFVNVAENHFLTDLKSLVLLNRRSTCVRGNGCDFRCTLKRRLVYFYFLHSGPTDKSERGFCVFVVGSDGVKWMENEDSVMIMRSLISFFEYTVRAQPIGCQIKTPVSMTKCSPLPSQPQPLPTRPYRARACVCVFPPNKPTSHAGLWRPSVPFICS